MTPKLLVNNDIVKAFEAVHATGRAASAPGGVPPGGEMEQRVSALEKAFAGMDGKLEKLVDGQTVLRERLASMDAKLDAKASAIEVSEVKGRINSLPTTWQMITLIIGTVFTILGGSFLILKFGLPHSS